MIVPMKKIHLVFLDRYKDAALRRLRQLAVVHLKYDGRNVSTPVELEDRLATINSALAAISENKKPAAKAVYPGKDAAWQTVEKIAALVEESHKLKERIQIVEREMARVDPWGDFDPQSLARLAEKGWPVVLYQLPKTMAADFPVHECFKINQDKTHLYLARVNRSGGPASDLPGFELPEKSLSAMREERQVKLARLQIIKKELAADLSAKDILIQAKAELEKEIEFEGVKAGLGQEGPLVYVSGFLPADQLVAFKRVASENAWAILIKDPTDDDDPPTKLKNSRLVSLIKPVLDFLGTVPGYREHDISFVFLPFFTIFFGLLIGDAGYGAIFVLGALLANLKLKKINLVIALLYFLGAVTIAWGAVTGTWFGSRTLVVAIPLLGKMIIPSVSNYLPDGSANPASTATIQLLCFNLGLAHLCIAHLMRIIRCLKQKSIQFVTEIGNMCLVLGIYNIVLFLVIGGDSYPIPDRSIYLIGAGIVINLLFSGQQAGRNPLAAVALTTVNISTWLGFINYLSDLISYIRLFAVGLATFAIAQSFNAMGAGFAGSPMIVFGVIIIVFGHALNFVLAIMAILVHDVRLNMLEFSSHLGMEWSGTAYAPFTENK